jgi:hypothetical protein
MRSLLFAACLTFAGSATAAAPMSAIQCAMTADALFVLIQGQQIALPEWMHPMLRRAAEHYRANQQKEPYWHSTTLLLECLRTGGVADEMYDPRRMADPEKPRRTT